MLGLPTSSINDIRGNKGKANDLTHIAVGDAFALSYLKN